MPRKRECAAACHSCGSSPRVFMSQLQGRLTNPKTRARRRGAAAVVLQRDHVAVAEPHRRRTNRANGGSPTLPSSSNVPMLDSRSRLARPKKKACGSLLRPQLPSTVFMPELQQSHEEAPRSCGCSPAGSRRSRRALAPDPWAVAIRRVHVAVVVAKQFHQAHEQRPRRLV